MKFSHWGGGEKKAVNVFPRKRGGKVVGEASLPGAQNLRRWGHFELYRNPDETAPVDPQGGREQM